MRWYKNIQEILETEPEVWLNYLDGQQYDAMPHRQKKTKKPSFFFVRFIIFFIWVLKRSHIRRRETILKDKILIYAGSANEKSAVSTVHSELMKMGLKSLTLSKPKRANSKKRGNEKNPIEFSISDLIKSTIISIKRSKKIISDLDSKNPELTKYKLDSFLKPLAFICYFERTLSSNPPKMILVSNDHNPANRSVLATARLFGIPTGYLQHASVSKLFPALTFDYAFLDGRHSLDYYNKNTANKPNNAKLTPSDKIFLTGQKKPIKRSGPDIKGTIGYAFNLLDSKHAICSLIEKLSERDLPLRLRWHPRMDKARKALILSYADSAPNIEVSDPDTETVNAFLSKISCLVAGDSSIHLEAAESATPTIYFQLDATTEMHDYYGFVANGLSTEAASYEELLSLIERKTKNRELPPTEAIQHYSATYGTDWEGREGELVAILITSLLAGKGPEHYSVLGEPIFKNNKSTQN